MKISVEQVYTSIACNRTPEIVDWNSDGLICYGGSNAVVIYDTKAKSIDPITILSHHHGRVNSVKWLRKPDGTSTELVSCSADKTAAIWTLKDRVWTVTSTLEGHKDGVMCIHGTYHGDKLLVFTGSIDSTIKVWERNENGVAGLKLIIPLQSGLCLTLHSHMLPVVNEPILFCALDDHKIHLFTGEDFHRVHQMVGHEDWVRGLDVLPVDNSAILLASCSQDTYIRLWRIQVHSVGDGNISVEKKVFQAYGEKWDVKLDAVLGGHEGWVYGVQWHPPVVENGKKKIVHSLLSSSLDKSLIVWQPESSGAWVERVRLGEVGGSGLGFYGSRFGPNGEVLAHGYNGSFHIWSCCQETKHWQPSVVCGGHFNAVEDVRWEPTHGRYIMSLSADQTTRVHAPWKKHDGTSEWHELARPQVHGYDMQALALISGGSFASAAEEKVIRIFDAPTNFIHNFANITGEVLEERSDKGIAGASVPSLGLSNKAVFSGEEGKDADDDGYFVPMTLTEPPTEETLMQNTLWPEQQKLYGHGYEVFALATSPDGALLASACKATTLEHAALILWDTKTWKQIQSLPSHALTVTQIEFSPNSQKLLSVSRDRRWTLFQRRQDADSFELAACTDKSNGLHARIVWCCAWSCDGEMFSTGSRDGKVCVWSKTEILSDTSLKDYGLYGKALDIKDSVIALAFAPLPTSDKSRIVAVGTETGSIRIYSFDGMWNLLQTLDHSAAHHLTVKRVAFKPTRERDGTVLLASCGADHLVRVHAVSIT